MIFQKLTLQNFGQYRGKHVIDMTNPSLNRPILLIGGKNGCGKTTILDAMQLCLYGKRSNCYARSGQGWDKFLRSFVNRDNDKNAETRIKVVFIHPYEGKQTEFKVVFSWQLKGTKITSRKEVYKDGKIDDLFTEAWDKFIDSVLPARLSTLFFFDGEQIEDLVKPETAKVFLQSAIVELLGIGILDKLYDDLSTLNRNKALTGNTKNESKKLKELEALFSETKKQICHLEDHLAMLRTEQAKASKERHCLELEYETKGGRLLDEQTSNENLKRELLRQLEGIEKQIIKFRSGILPFNLVSDKLLQIKNQINHEQEATKCSQQKEQLSEFHTKYIAAAEKSGASAKVLSALTKLSEKERKRLDDQIKNNPVYLDVSSNCLQLLDSVIHELPEQEKEYNALLLKKEQIQKRIDKLDAKLDATPEKGELADLHHKRRAVAKKLSAIEIDILSKEELKEQLETQSKKHESQIIELLQSDASTQAQKDDDQRTIYYSQKTQEYLKKFRSVLLKKHLGTLETHILESFLHLIAKTTLVKNLTIDPVSFAISLVNSENKIIPAEKLSAGERQLLAIAIFWGLQKASCRPVPVMIDTPMGRLDSIHREHLVKRYFPLAAHQVVLLSTDEEITGEYFKSVSKHTYNQLTVTYSQDDSSSCIKEGYFA